jgi:hypothetical protein
VHREFRYGQRSIDIVDDRPGRGVFWEIKSETEESLGNGQVQQRLTDIANGRIKGTFNTDPGFWVGGTDFPDMNVDISALGVPIGHLDVHQSTRYAGVATYNTDVDWSAVALFGVAVFAYRNRGRIRSLMVPDPRRPRPVPGPAFTDDPLPPIMPPDGLF